MKNKKNVCLIGGAFAEGRMEISYQWRAIDWGYVDEEEVTCADVAEKIG